jgi:RNA polymerase sigma-70 factor (ECF subfamily)
MVLEAKQGPAARATAQEQLMERYSGAVYSYLLGIVRDTHTADDLAQEFALRFLRGDFRRADPQRGRFRNFLKTAVLNLVTDHHRRQKARPQFIAPDSPEPAANAESTSDLDRQFVDSWRHELVARAWEALEHEQQRSDQPFYTVLRCRSNHPELRSAQLAAELSRQLGKPVTDNWVRQVLHRARKLFADHLLDDVMQSLDNPSPEQVEEELVELGLLEYCRPALERRNRGF